MEQNGREDLMYYHIGIIDDDRKDRADIQVSILDNLGYDAQIDFKEYVLKSRTKEDILREIREDIQEENIHALIVDFKLDTTKVVIEGWEIIDFMHEETSEFPVVILTNVPDESKESRYTDADKVYNKKVFLDPSLPQTKEMVNNIWLNMQRYSIRRGELEANLVIEQEKLSQNGTDESILKKVIEIEEELGKYKQIYTTTLDASLNLDSIKDILEGLKKYEDLLG
ncbi:MAG: hypothetical protein KHZ58_15960 [Hungatella hathewayi]|nr:hypothetical protein [Hungatella hathewayi]